MLTTTLTQTPLQRQFEFRLERIQHHKKKNAKIMLEEVWNKFALIRLQNSNDAAFSVIMENNIIKSLMNNTANSFYIPWKKNSRLSIDDFISVIYEATWRVIESYSPYGQWYLYEHLTNALPKACIDLLRQQGLTKTRQNKNTLFHMSSSLTDGEDDIDIPDTSLVTDMVAINVWLEQVLDGDELKLAKLLVLNPFINSTDICCELKIPHRQQAIRLLNRVKLKLRYSHNKD